jgi:hypothetical protein
MKLSDCPGISECGVLNKIKADAVRLFEKSLGRLRR